jgi:ubiquinone/menaquinone biosynthesis C-methylase UbiE
MHTNSVSTQDRLIRPWAHPRGLLGHLAGIEMSVGRRGDVGLALELLGLVDGARVIEVGCGPGVTAHALAKAVGSGSVTAVDPSRAMLDQARLRNRRAVATGHVQLLQGAAEALPADGPFTHYLSMYTAGYWVSIERGLQEARRVLALGGLLAIGARRLERVAEIAELARATGFATVVSGERAIGRRRVGVVTAIA